MFIITFKGRPASLEAVYTAERGGVPIHITGAEREGYIAAPSAAKAKALFLYYIGFTWLERATGIEVARVPNESLVIQGKAAPGTLPGYAAPGEN